MIHLGDGLGAAGHADLRPAPQRFSLIAPKLVRVAGGDYADVDASGCIASRAAGGVVLGATKGVPEGEAAVEASSAGAAAGARSAGYIREGLGVGAEAALPGRAVAHALLEEPK
jgi:hypothetical protein